MPPKPKSDEKVKTVPRKPVEAHPTTLMADWKELEKNLMILSGSCSQAHKKFKGYNQQGAATCIVACAIAALNKMPTWTREALDLILDVGTNLYLKSRQIGDNKCKSHMGPNQIYKYFYVHNLKVSMKVGPLSETTRIIQDSYILQKIEEFLTNSFSKYNSAVVTHQHTHFAIWKFYKYYFLFDPTDHNEEGGKWEGLPGFGHCYCVRSTTAKPLADIIFKNCDIKRINNFTIHPCVMEKVVMFNTTPPETLAEAQPSRPIEAPLEQPKIKKRSIIKKKKKDEKTEEKPPDVSVEQPPPEAAEGEEAQKTEQAKIEPKKSVSKSKIPPERPKLDSVTNFVQLDPGRRGILRATTHQNDPKFTRYMGAQSFGEAIAALTMLRQYKAKVWIRKIVDDVLRLGEQIHHDMKKLPPGEYPQKVTLDEKDYTPNINKYGVIGRVESDDDKILNLEEAIKDTLVGSDCCILICVSVLAVWKEDNKFYMFDPAERDAFGLAVQPGQAGVACVTWFTKPADLVAHYCANIPKSSRKSRFMLCKVTIEDYLPKAEDWFNFKALASQKWILRGNFSQQDRRFPPETRNSQCTAMSTMALAYKELKEEKEWNPETVDQVLVRGDEFYKDCVDHLQETGLFKDKCLMVDELKRSFDVENKRVQLEIDDCLVNGIINAKSDTGILNLKRGFEQFFADSEAGIVTANMQSMAVWRRDDTYYYYDSHSRNDKGRACGFGTACVLRMVTIEDLTNAFVTNLGADRQNLYNISRITVQLFDISEDGAVKPPLNFFEALNDFMAILRSNTSHKDKKYFIDAGKQEVPMCLAALTLNTVSPSFDWNKEDVDQILTLGDKLYVESMEANYGEDVPEEINVDDITTTNVKKEMKIGPNKFEMEFEDFSLGNVEENLKEAIENLDTKSKEEGIESFQSILESQFMIVSMWRDDNLIYLFDPRPRDERGQVYGKDDWSIKHDGEGEEEEEEGDEGEGETNEEPEDDKYNWDDDKDELGGGDNFGEPEQVVTTNTYEEPEQPPPPPSTEEQDNYGYGNEEIEEEQEEEEEEEPTPVVEKKGSEYWRTKEEEGKACILRFSRVEDVIQHLIENTPPNQRQELEFTLKLVKVNNTPILREIFDPEIEEKEEDDVIRGDWFDFKEIDYGKWILRSIRNDEDALFPESNRGKQEIPMCMIALMFANIYALSKFKTEVVNNLLAYGDRFYTVVRKLRAKNLKSNKELALTDDEIEDILKSTDFKIMDYPAKLCMGEKMVTWEANLEVVSGDVSSKNPEIVSDLSTGLTKFFEENTDGIIQCRRYPVAVWKNEDFYYMFDPHPTGPSGSKSPVGTSCITRFKELEDLVQLYLGNLPEFGDNFFEISAFSFVEGVCLRERRPEEKEEKIARIGGFRPVMAGKEILRGDVKLDCSKFDRAVNIHSAAIAFVALALSLNKDPDTWTRLIINEILTVGEELHKDTLEKLGPKFNPWSDRLNVCQVNTDFMIGKLKVNTAIRFMEQKGIVDIKNSKTTPNLRQGIERFFEENSHGILVADKFIFALWEQPKGEEVSIFLYDPNSRGPTGLPAQGGVACVMKFCNAKVASDHIKACMMDIDKTKTEFSIIPVEIAIASAKTKMMTVCKVPPEKEILVVKQPPCPTPAVIKPPTCPTKVDLLDVKRILRKVASEERTKKEAIRCFALGRKEMYYITDNEAIIRGLSCVESGRELPINAVAFVFMRLSPDLNKWTSKQIESILEAGNQLYIDSLVAYNLQPSKLTIQHLLRRLIVGNVVEIKIEFKKPIIGGSFEREFLLSNLTSFFTLTNFCILSYDEQLVSLYFKSGYYWLFDPYSRDLNGNKTKHGCAMLMRFGDLSCLIEKLLINLQDPNDEELPRRYALIVTNIISVEPLTK